MAQNTRQSDCSRYHIPIDQRNIPIVFIPGIKGSKLVNNKGKISWVTLGQAFGRKKNGDLALPLKWSEHPNEEGVYVQEKDDHVAAGVLGKVGIIKFYDRVFNTRKIPRPFYEYGYDWRRDLNETILDFEKYLLEVSAKHENNKIQIIAHSLGGLLTFGIINKNPELVHSAVLAGTPFSEGIGFLLDLHGGVKNGLNKEILSPDVLFTFPSVFNFSMQNDLQYAFESTADGIVPIEMNLHTSEDWYRHHLSVFRDESKVTDAHRRHLEICLHNSRKFRERYIKYDPNIHYPPINIIASEAHPTLVRILKNGPRSQKTNGIDFVTADRATGDGRVSLRGAMPPWGVPHRLFLSEQPHGTLLEDPMLRVLVRSLTLQIKVEMIRRQRADEKRIDDEVRFTAAVNPDSVIASLTR